MALSVPASAPTRSKTSASARRRRGLSLRRRTRPVAVRRATLSSVLAGAEALEACLELAHVLDPTTSPFDVLALDVSAARQIDASGLAALVRLHSRLRAQKRRLQIVGAVPAVREVLETIGVSGLFAVEPQAAREGFSRPAVGRRAVPSAVSAR